MMRILLAEDEPFLLSTIADRLSRSGYDVVTANSAAQLKEKLASGTFDLIVSDVNLGDGSAMPLIGMLRAGLYGMDKCDTRFIIMSGHAKEKILSDDAVRGATFPFLEKPFSLAQMVSTIRQISEKPPGVHVA